MEYGEVERGRHEDGVFERAVGECQRPQRGLSVRSSDTGLCACVHFRRGGRRGRRGRRGGEEAGEVEKERARKRRRAR